MHNCIFCKQFFEDPLAFGPEKNPPYKVELDLGNLFPSAFVPQDFDYSKAIAYPTKLISCSNCGFVQLSDWPNQDDMYRAYFYRSNLNSSMVEALADVIAGVYKRYPAITNGFRSHVLDIAANDSTLLGMYPKHWFRVGVDPASNLVDYSKDKCDLFINDYFSSKLKFWRSFDIITCIAMFYDLTDPDDFMFGVKYNLAKDGVFVVQMTDLASMIKSNAFDNICHEHCGYWTLRNFWNLMEQFDLDVFDVEYNDVNGASIRIYVCHKGSRKPNLSVSRALRSEQEINHANALSDLDDRITEYGNKVMAFLGEQKKQGKTICGLGASTKGNTLMNTWGISHNHLKCIGEVNSDKFGLYTIGSHIPIVSERDMFDMKPAYILCLPWHFSKGIISRNQEFLRQGGKFIFPLPQPCVVSIDGTEML